MLAQWRRRRARRRRSRERIDPFAVGEPWRHHVMDALQAQGRFQRVVDGMDGGPLRERLEAIGHGVEQGARECWRIAQQGDALDAAVATVGVPRVATPVDARLATVERLRAQADQADRELAVLCIRLQEAVAAAVELSVGGSDTGPLGRDAGRVVDAVVDDLVALRAALDETHALGQ